VPCPAHNKSFHSDRSHLSDLDDVIAKEIELIFKLPASTSRQVNSTLDSKSTNFTKSTANNLTAIKEIDVTGIEKSDY
jgi:hypothetical protein